MITAVVVVVTIIATITAGGTSVFHVEVFIVFSGRRFVVLVVGKSTRATVLGQSLNVGARHFWFLEVLVVVEIL